MTATYTFDVFSSLDGYGAASANWTGYWGKQGPELLDHRLALYDAEQRMVFGANTYRAFARMLASSTEESEVRDPWVTRMRNLPAIVVSTTLEEPLDWPDATLVSGDAVKRVRTYHEAQKKASGESWSYRDADGTLLGQKVTPLDRVGIYVPGGKAAYPSSVLMNAIPAQVAGVGEIVMVVPTPRGERNALVLAAAHVAGVTRVRVARSACPTQTSRTRRNSFTICWKNGGRGTKLSWRPGQAVWSVTCDVQHTPAGAPRLPSFFMVCEHIFTNFAVFPPAPPSTSTTTRAAHHGRGEDRGDVATLRLAAAGCRPG